MNKTSIKRFIDVFLFKKTILFVLIVTYIILSVFHLKSIFDKHIHQAGESALLKANTISKSINVKRLIKLNASIEDTASLDYKYYKDKLIELRKINGDVRFMYFLQKKNDRIFFLVDSEPQNSDDYSFPGDEYINESDNEVKIPFITGQPLITNPTVDKWGNWVSVLVPMTDYNGKTIDILFCMDYDAELWYAEARNHVLVSSLMLVAVLFFLLSLLSILKSNVKQKNIITQLKETRNDLILAKEQAEVASVAKSQFLSNMSHEIRTPLNGVIGFSELLHNTSLNSIQQEYVENTIQSANSLLLIINDILDFSKIEAGKLELELVETDLITLVENTADMIKLLAAKKNLELLVNIQPDMPRYVIIDPVRVRQILINLLSNAVKFTTKGEVELKVNFNILNADEGKICFAVRDTGIGIKESDKSKLFNAFSQADNSTTRKFGGTGLGLSISKSLAEKMGGTITIESEYGKGSVFDFCFRTKFKAGNTKKIKPKVTSVLVIDDNENNRKILEHTLNYWGIKFTGAESGFDALDLLKNEFTFDLIVVDYHMPDLNGIETIKKIREIVPDNQQIIMLQSSADASALYNQAIEYNVKYILTKPIKHDELYNYFCSIDIDIDNLKIDATTSEVFKLDLYAKILVVEDNVMNMMVITTMLKNALPNVEIYEAINGLKAIEQATTHKPDLILMDVQMPELDGISASKILMQKKALNHSRIVALTAGVSTSEREACYNAGMCDFLAKPIVKKELERILQTYLNDCGTEKSFEFKENIRTIRFDFNKLLEKLGNQNSFKTILNLALDEYPKYLNELEYAIQAGDWVAIKRIVHKLKGSASNMEFVEMVSILDSMDFGAENPVKLTDTVAKLREEWNYISIEIQKLFL